MFKRSKESAVLFGGKKEKMVAADFSLRNKIRGGGIMKKHNGLSVIGYRLSVSKSL